MYIQILIIHVTPPATTLVRKSVDVFDNRRPRPETPVLRVGPRAAPGADETIA
jgi:hypothetical protein